jgi:hypothetical protein
MILVMGTGLNNMMVELCYGTKIIIGLSLRLQDVFSLQLNTNRFYIILIMHDSTILHRTSIIESRLISSQISWINEHWKKIMTVVEL